MFLTHAKNTDQHSITSLQKMLACKNKTSFKKQICLGISTLAGEPKLCHQNSRHIICKSPEAFAGKMSFF